MVSAEHSVVEVQGARHWPFTQSRPLGHWASVVQAFGSGCGVWHRPWKHTPPGPHLSSLSHSFRQVPLMQ
ncbi:hypothetical protein [Corallococcus sp. 4LFB]|uniref:hypothetical protein n=1 Tax=Corallococcus sp. 4LFB TaxID=3383249 RepID=UPI003975247E